MCVYRYACTCVEPPSPLPPRSRQYFVATFAVSGRSALPQFSPTMEKSNRTELKKKRIRRTFPEQQDDQRRRKHRQEQEVKRAPEALCVYIGGVWSMHGAAGVSVG